MSGLWIAALAITAAVIALMVMPLLRRPGPARERAAYDRAVWRDQLAEIDRDVERGLLEPDQAAAARLEIKRRILAAGDGNEERADGRGSAPVLAGALALVVAVVAFGLYAYLGHPGLEDQPLASRDLSGATASASGPAGQGPTLEQAEQRLAARLQETPDDLEGWLLLGRTRLSLQHYDDAAVAFAHALELSGGAPEIAASYGEAIIGADGGQVGADARTVFEAVLARDPRNPKARFYLALAKAQDGDLPGALQGWVDLEAISPPDAPWLALVRRQIRQAAAATGVDPATIAPSDDVAALAPSGAATAVAPPPGPSRADVDAAAEMTDAERTAMIRAMVERLAARLQEQPDDLEGWRRLARAWEVLGETDRAAEARARIEALESN